MPGSLLLRCISWSLLLDLSIHGQVATPAVIGVPKRVEHLHPDITDRFGIQGKAVFVSGLGDFYVFPGVSRHRDRKSVVQGKSVAVRVELGGRRIIKKKTQTNQ